MTEFIKETTAEPVSEEFESVMKCPDCGNNHKYIMQGLLPEGGYVDMVRIVTICETCKYQIVNNIPHRFCPETKLDYKLINMENKSEQSRN